MWGACGSCAGQLDRAGVPPALEELLAGKVSHRLVTQGFSDGQSPSMELFAIPGLPLISLFLPIWSISGLLCPVLGAVHVGPGSLQPQDGKP